jgi:penicillin-binding protein 2
MPGVKLNVKPGRLYVAGQGFSHILGYIGDQSPDEVKELQRKGYKRNEPVGKSGIEARYEDDLRGKIGVSAVQQDAQGHLIDTLETHDPVAGNSLKLAIDPGLQDYVQQLLEDTRQEANVAAAVVMSPKTGEVYALVSLPTYDSNIFSQLGTRGAEYNALVNDPRKPFLDWALAASAPGSTFKLVTAAAALQEGNITPNTGRTVDSTILQFKGENGVIYPLYDWKVHGYIDLYGAIAWSSNIYFYMASCGIPQEGIRGLGKNPEDSAYKLANYARIFGLGQPTGIDVGDESWGIIPTPAWKAKVHNGPGFDENDRQWYISDTCFMGIGQLDVTATPVQIARMTAAVANGGKLLTPHVVNEVVSTDGKTLRSVAPEYKEIPIDRANLAVIRQGMHLSVLQGAGARAFTSGIDITGKTGTAEFTDPKTGKTLQHAWFTGFAPFNDPQVVVTVYYDLGVGGDKAAPTAGKIFDYFMKNVKP